jgi:hypothetical protein
LLLLLLAAGHFVLLLLLLPRSKLLLLLLRGKLDQLQLLGPAVDAHCQQGPILKPGNKFISKKVCDYSEKTERFFDLEFSIKS